MPRGEKTKSLWQNSKYRKHMSEVQKGHIPWSKSQKGVCLNTGRTHFKKGQNAGSKHPRWQGGRIKRKEYIAIWIPNHPFCNCVGYVLEHRLVIEQYLGRYLTLKERCHHLGKKTDNRLHMLMAFSSNSAHQRFHKNPNNVKPEEIIFNGQNLFKI